jgi:DNA mismatch repair ATPase MutS
MGHPLIASRGRVNNSFKMGPENIMLITGANMAGKSTFLRTAGVNLILALAGSSVCAKYFACPLISLHTSMRATDSLVDHQSYFYAELSRLKGIMEEVRSNKPMLVLLDEILRGTNSKDKQEGSIGLLNQFVAHDVLLMLASHDVVLGELEKKYPSAIRNYCFESEIENNELTFDYTLHQGVANKANATFLMQQMGILPKA